MDQIPPERLAVLQQENRSPLIIGLVVAFTVLAFVSVCLRFLTRIVFMRNVGIEDYFIALSMCFSITMGIAQVYQVKWGGGKHAMFLPPSHIENSLKFLFISILCYCISLILTRLSILLQYRRIFTFRNMRIRIYIVMGFCLCYATTALLTGILSCVPVDAFWDLSKKPTAKCVNIPALFYANASINVLTDLLVAFLPVKGIWELKLPRRQKGALLGILTIGWFVCIVSILRLTALIELGTHPEDQTWHGAGAAYWSAIEVNLSIVCASAPALKPLVGKIIPHFSSSNHSYVTHNLQSLRDSRLPRSFVELKSNRRPTTSSDNGSGKESDSTAALSYPGTLGGTGGNIIISRDIEQYSEPIGRKSESSQQELVAPFAEPAVHGGSRS